MCGDAPPLTISSGVPTPSITAATSEWIGLMVATTLGAADGGAAEAEAAMQRRKDQPHVASPLSRMLCYYVAVLCYNV